MKRYLFLLIPLLFFIILLETHLNAQPVTINKIALRYEGGEPIEYDIPDVEYDPGSFEPTKIATLTDESNGLKAGVIGAVYCYITDGPNSGWIQYNGTYSPEINEDTVDWLNGKIIDLRTVKRKKVIIRWREGEGVLEPSEEEL